MFDDKTTYKVQRWAAWAGPFFVVTYFIFWVGLGHNFPPPVIGQSAADLVANHYVKYQEHIRLGMAFSAWLGIIYVIWSIQLALQMWRREKVPVLSLMELLGGCLTGWVLATCAAEWTWCATWAGTPGVPDELVKEVHVRAWYIYDMTWTVTAIQCWGCGFFALLDKKQPSVFPRWIGWLAIFTPVAWFPLIFLPWNHSGIWSVSGYWGFHVVFIIWGVWFCSYSYYMFQDLKRIRVSAVPGIGQAMSHGTAE